MEKINTISAVVCTLNSESSIEECLKSLKLNNVDELILVDGGSSDKTVEIATPYCDLILRDPGKGLAVARNLGISKAKNKYVLNCGADNVITEGALQILLSEKERNNWCGISMITNIRVKNYFTWCLNVYKVAHEMPGETNVPGTPVLFETIILKENLYDPEMSWSDDADLCERLSKLGYKFGISNAICFEIGQEGFDKVLYRWINYGRSDFEIYRKYSPKWTLKRKFRSIGHPFRSEISTIFRNTSFFKWIAVLPVLLFFTLLRYFGWAKFLIKSKKK
jgi:glycosyltransferase involved in cell wall biosynthesis